jgi:hypothetical protein
LAETLPAYRIVRFAASRSQFTRQNGQSRAKRTSTIYACFGIDMGLTTMINAKLIVTDPGVCFVASPSSDASLLQREPSLPHHD